MITPAQFLLVTLLITVAAASARAVYLYRVRRGFRAMARRWQMHYVHGDRLRLAVRVAQSFPVPGAGDLRVRDLMFRTTGNVHQYLFTIEYSTGVIAGRQRHTRAGGFYEPVTRSAAAAPCGGLLLAPVELPIMAQYEAVFQSLARDGQAT